MSTASQLLRGFQTLRDRPSRLADFLREPRPLVVGGPTVNRMGLQVVRACKEAVAWRLRSPRVPPHIRDAYETIERDGVVVIPDFLPQDEFQRVRDEYTESLRHPGVQRTSFGENFLCQQLHATDFPERFPHTMRILRDSDFLLDLAAAVSRRARTYKPHITFFTVGKPDPNAAFSDHDDAQFAHPDRHYPFVKVFFYLNDIDETRAPFSYAKGTHKFTLERLRFEYEHSIRFAERDDAVAHRTPARLQAESVLRDCVERSMQNQATSCEPIVGKRNTLIVANNQGFHKRGAFNSDQPREVVYIDFKYLESPAQWLYPLLKHLYRT